ncbi:MAG: biopolymer transporter ExbD [Planctomycetaceae bacterium]|jgi:biopolymer transport protein ExbD|nr:biopolymer transporter ExbD [Planctomycetaceae bacterium]
MKTNYSNPRGRTSLDSMMTPMIDVVFLLLVFFLTTASFQRLEKLLPSSVSAKSDTTLGESKDTPPSPPQEDIHDCVIKIKAQGDQIEYQWNGLVVKSLQDIQERLVAILNVRADVPIIVDPEDSILAGDALRVYDTAKRAGATAVYMVAR